MTHYEVLGVNENATIIEIKSAYRELGKKYHPDLNGDKFTEKMAQANAAYAILGDAETRAMYDEQLLADRKEQEQESNETNNHSSNTTSDNLNNSSQTKTRQHNVSDINSSGYYSKFYSSLASQTDDKSIKQRINNIEKLIEQRDALEVEFDKKRKNIPTVESLICEAIEAEQQRRAKQKMLENKLIKEILRQTAPEKAKHLSLKQLKQKVKILKAIKKLLQKRQIIDAIEKKQKLENQNKHNVHKKNIDEMSIKTHSDKKNNISKSKHQSKRPINIKC